MSELVLSPDEIDYPDIDRPDALIVLSEDGLAKVDRYLAAERTGRYAEENLETVRAAMAAWTPEAAG